MHWKVVCVLILFAPVFGVTSAMASPEVPPPSGRVVSPDARLELLYTRSAPISGGLTEGPAVGPDGAIYFTDIPSGTDKGLIVRFDPRTKKSEIFIDDSGKANGLAFDRDGYLVGCQGADLGGRAVVRWNLATKTSEVLADRFDGKRFNAPNDLDIDSQGRIYFSDPRYAGAEPRELEHRAVYRIDPDGKVHEITHEVEKPNGIAVSPDGKTLYVADHNNGTDRIFTDPNPPTPGAMKIYAFPLDRKGFVGGPRRTLIDFGADAGCDGMAVDSLGNVYLTVRGVKRPGVMVIDPNGKEVGFIPTGSPQPGAKEPVGLPSNCVFGIGDEINVLYVTVDKSLYRIRLEVDGFHRASKQQLDLLTRFRNEFVPIRPGEPRFPAEFQMGDNSGRPTSRPVRTVTMKHSFAINAYEVPQNLWEAVMGSNPSRWKGPRNSVELLSYDDAAAFCRNATVLLRSGGLIVHDQVIRLPTEAEWEYCARAGTTSTYYFGDELSLLDEHCWFHGNAAGNDPPVGAKKPNAWGLYDVYGYLWEWCADPWHASYRRAPVDGWTWTKDGDDALRVLRGGSWKDKADRCSSTFRRAARRGLRDDAVGLRCVLDRVK